MDRGFLIRSSLARLIFLHMVAVVIIMKAVMKRMWSSVIHCFGLFVSCYLKPALACALSDLCVVGFKCSIIPVYFLEWFLE